MGNDKIENFINEDGMIATRVTIDNPHPIVLEVPEGMRIGREYVNGALERAIANTVQTFSVAIKERPFEDMKKHVEEGVKKTGMAVGRPEKINIPLPKRIYDFFFKQEIK